jgi:VIT1/CCC1 family predicted Fe2+/Mn2+ transporter
MCEHDLLAGLQGTDSRSIIGLSDGLTVPFALTAGLSSLGSSRLVVTGGIAELCAGAISMGLGGYRGSYILLIVIVC